MITLIIVLLLAALVYFLWRNERQGRATGIQDTQDHLSIWLLIGLLTLVALFYPQVKEKIRSLRQKIR
jgi:heme/copper-type cytochrome/quinol oxidase subunit 2